MFSAPGSSTKTETFAMEKKKEETMSLRVITLNIHGLKYWAQIIEKMPVIFEIFGMYYGQSKIIAPEKRNQTKQMMFCQKAHVLFQYQK